MGSRKMDKILKSKYGLLIFSLISGLAYFILIMMLISKINYSYLLGFFFFPAVVCGAALCLYKSIKGMEEAEEYKKIKSMIMIHYFVILLALVFIIVALLSLFV